VNYKHDSRAPLLFIAEGRGPHHAAVGEQVEREALQGNTVTDYHDFPGRSHWTCGEPGWEAVADYALKWAVANAR
jgi:hypothetical protein